MLLDTIRVGPNTYMGVSRACDEAMAAPSSVTRASLDPFLRGVTFLTTKGLDEILANKANRQCHFKTYRALDPYVSTGIIRHGNCSHDDSRRYIVTYGSKFSALYKLFYK